MNNKTLLSTLAAAAALALSSAAHAATVVIDTGTPVGSDFPLVLDSSDSVAAKVSFANATTVDSIYGHMLGVTAGDTFDISLYADKSGVPDSRSWSMYTFTATYGADGWNGTSGLGWTVAAGTYWIQFEMNWDDSEDSVLFDVGVPQAVTTKTTADNGLDYSVAPSIGLQVSTVPWPASASTMLAGLALLASLAIARRRA